MEVAKIQLKDVARTWWLAEEARLEKPISWDQFSKGFYERFFPTTAPKEMRSSLSSCSSGIDRWMGMLLNS